MRFCVVPNIDEDQSTLFFGYEYGDGYRLKSEILNVGGRNISFPRGYLAISGDVFGCHS